MNILTLQSRGHFANQFVLRTEYVSISMGNTIEVRLNGEPYVDRTKSLAVIPIEIMSNTPTIDAVIRRPSGKILSLWWSYLQSGFRRWISTSSECFWGHTYYLPRLLFDDSIPKEARYWRKR